MWNYVDQFGGKYQLAIAAALSVAIAATIFLLMM